MTAPVICDDGGGTRRTGNPDPIQPDPIDRWMDGAPCMHNENKNNTRQNVDDRSKAFSPSAPRIFIRETQETDDSALRGGGCGAAKIHKAAGALERGEASSSPTTPAPPIDKIRLYCCRQNRDIERSDPRHLPKGQKYVVHVPRTRR